MYSNGGFMNTNQFIELIKEEIKRLNEGLYDKGIFKAVFLAGGPGLSLIHI